MYPAQGKLNQFRERHPVRAPAWPFLVLLALSLAVVPHRGEAATPAPKPLTICANQAIPAGYVVTAFSKTSACGSRSGVWNTMTLKAYQGLKSFSACAPLPNIPNGYLITALQTTAPCAGGQGGLVPWNTMTLTAYQGVASINACMPLPTIPPGYVITARTRTSACSGPPGPNTVTLKRL
jgi:hypothetical protein